MNLPRIEAGGRDHAVVRRSQLSPRLTEDGTIGQVERLEAQLEVLRADHEPLVGRGVQADDPRSDQRVSLDGAVSERVARWNAIDERVGVEVAGPRALVARQLPVDAGGVGIADAAAVLNVARTARHGERKPVLQREDAAHLPAAEHQVNDASAIEILSTLAERQIP